MKDEHYSLEQAVVLAAKKGCKVVLPADNELFIDIDSDEDLAWFNSHIDIFPNVVDWTMTPSPSGRNGRFHIRVELGVGIGAMERIAAQACLGSDRFHELLSLMSLNNGVEQPTLFFERL